MKNFTLAMLTAAFALSASVAQAAVIPHFDTEIDGVGYRVWVIDSLQRTAQISASSIAAITAEEIILPETATDPATGDQWQIVQVYKQGFAGLKKTKYLTVANTITRVENNAFKANSAGGYPPSYVCALEEVNFGSGVKSVGDNVFQQCPNLKYCDLSPATEVIGASMFEQCYKLEEIVIPASLRQMGKKAFYQCKGLKKVTFEQGSQLTAIPQMAFNTCQQLETLELPEGVATLEYSSLNNCTGLKTLTLPSTLTEVQDIALKGLTSLTTLTINATVPPTAPEGKKMFGGTDMSQCTLVVPAGSEQAYGEAEEWSGFKITTATGIRQAEAAEAVSTVYTDASGKTYSQPVSGLNIVTRTTADGKREVAKIMIAK